MHKQHALPDLDVWYNIIGHPDSRSTMLCSHLRFSTFLSCRCEGTAVAVRVALSVDDINNAQTEVAVYHHLQQLQGEHMPQLLDYGWSGQAFCVVMTFVQV